MSTDKANVPIGQPAQTNTASSAVDAGSADQVKPSANHTDKPSPPPTATPSGRYRRFKEWHENWLPLINVTLAVLAVVVVIIQSRIMSRQTQIMDTQTRISQQSLDAYRVSERAYVGVASLTANLEASEIVIVLNNMGSVPAQAITLDGKEIRVTPSASLESTASGERINESEQGSEFHWEAGTVKLSPGTPTPVVVSLKPFNADEVNAVKTKKQLLYVGGTIQYEDGFGKRESTAFAFQYDAPNQRWIVHSGLSRFFQ